MILHKKQHIKIIFLFFNILLHTTAYGMIKTNQLLPDNAQIQLTGKQPSNNDPVVYFKNIKQVTVFMTTIKDSGLPQQLANGNYPLQVLDCDDTTRNYFADCLMLRSPNEFPLPHHLQQYSSLDEYINTREQKDLAHLINVTDQLAVLDLQEILLKSLMKKNITAKEHKDAFAWINLNVQSTLIQKALKEKSLDKQITANHIRDLPKTLLDIQQPESWITHFFKSLIRLEKITQPCYYNNVSKTTLTTTKINCSYEAIDTINLHKENKILNFATDNKFSAEHITYVASNNAETLFIMHNTDCAYQYDQRIESFLLYAPSTNDTMQIVVDSFAHPLCIIPNSPDSYYYYDNNQLILKNLQTKEVTIIYRLDRLDMLTNKSGIKITCNNDGTIIALCTDYFIYIIQKNNEDQYASTKTYSLGDFERNYNDNNENENKTSYYFYSIQLNNKGNMLSVVTGIDTDKTWSNTFTSPLIYLVDLARDISPSSLEHINQKTTHFYHTIYLQFSKDDRFVAASNNDTYYLYDTISQKVIQKYTPHHLLTSCGEGIISHCYAVPFYFTHTISQQTRDILNLFDPNKVLTEEYREKLMKILHNPSACNHHMKNIFNQPTTNLTLLSIIRNYPYTTTLSIFILCALFLKYMHT